MRNQDPQPQTIKTLASIIQKPVCWMAVEDITHEYRLFASYRLPDKTQYFEIHTARGKQKIYKSIASMISDLKKVDADIQLQFHFTS